MLEGRGISEMRKESKKAQNFPYRRAVGALMYLMLGTRSDLAYSISVEDLSKTEEAVETEEKTHIHSAPGTPTPSLQNKIDDLPKLAQKPTIIESRNQRTASISSPISTATGTIKRDQKESTVHQKLKKDKEEKSRIETRQQSKK
ncbi:hypothetical protein JTB14_015573 [Gonioctena quinquepunctata]|nr:hypothetical protein JTB14_015573 [Gonioctena quinquepunctata]